MKAREKTAYQHQKEGDSEADVRLASEEAEEQQQSRRQYYFWWIKFWIGVAVAIMIISLISGKHITASMQLTGFIVAGFSILTLAASFYAGETAVMKPMLYVQGTGAMEDMKDAKERAQTLGAPFTGLFIAGVLLGLQFLLSFLI